MAGNISRSMDILEYPVLKGFSGMERVESVVIDPSLISGLTADAFGNFYVNAGTILTPIASSNKHGVLGGWVTGAESGAGGNNQKQGNNGTGVTAQVQKVTVTGTPTGGTFSLGDENGSETGAIKYNATAAEVQAALRALPKSSGGYTATGGAFPGTAVTVTSSGALLGTKSNLKLSKNELTGGTTPTVTIAQETEGQYISGILGINIRFFDATSVSAQAAPMLVADCNFDATRIQNYAFYATALNSAMRGSRFENPS